MSSLLAAKLAAKSDRLTGLRTVAAAAARDVV
jgi:hypothetical protein